MIILTPTDDRLILIQNKINLFPLPAGTSTFKNIYITPYHLCYSRFSYSIYKFFFFAKSATIQRIAALFSSAAAVIPFRLLMQKSWIFSTWNYKKYITFEWIFSVNNQPKFMPKVWSTPVNKSNKLAN